MMGLLGLLGYNPKLRIKNPKLSVIGYGVIIQNPKLRIQNYLELSAYNSKSKIKN